LGKAQGKKGGDDALCRDFALAENCKGKKNHATLKKEKKKHITTKKGEDRGGLGFCHEHALHLREKSLTKKKKTIEEETRGTMAQEEVVISG